jgi:magnesium transporter
MLYQALDRATDVTWHDLHSLFACIDGFEQELFSREIDPRTLLALKKKLNQIDVSIGLLASVASQLTNLCKPKDDLAWKLRDLHDHCERISKNVGLYRSHIATIIELFWGLQSNRTNRQIKKLTLLASVAVPMTFWASFWGMNFTAIPYSSVTLFIIALTIMGISVAVTTWLLIHKGYCSD